nr:diagnostic antigen gp50 [Hymenolepis microstoma]
MITILFVFTLLQLSASLGKEDLSLPYSTCSRIVATPFGKSDPLIFDGDERSALFAVVNKERGYASIKNNGCYIDDKLIGEPCSKHSDHLNITINDVTRYKDLRVFGDKFDCIAKVVPKCQFKPVEPGEIIPEVSFPFVRFAKGMSSVHIKFAIKGVNSTSSVRLFSF